MKALIIPALGWVGGCVAAGVRGGDRWSQPWFIVGTLT